MHLIEDISKKGEEVLSRLKDLSFCIMSNEEKKFITEMILKFKPVKVLELGVAKGGSSVILLNALKENNNNARLFSSDYFTNHWIEKDKLIGYKAIEVYPELTENWEIHRGGLIAEHIDEIGDGIDFCFIDTTHVNPGEILDFLMLFPYLKENAVVIFHDTCLHRIDENWSQAYTNCLLISAIKGQEKYQIKQPHGFPNISAVVLNKDTKENIFDIFNLLYMPWTYELNENDFEVVKNHLMRFYDSMLVDIFLKASQQNIVDDYAKKHFNVPRNIDEDETLGGGGFAPIQPHERNIFNFYRYRFLSKITFGKTRKKYKAKYKYLKSIKNTLKD